MKKLFLLLMLATNVLIVKAQITKYNYIWVTSADTVYVGDSAWVDVGAADGYPNEITDTIFIEIESTCGQTIVVAKKSYLDCAYTYPKHYDYYYNGSAWTHDSLVRFSFVIPEVCQLGENQYYAWDNNKPVFIKSRNQKPIICISQIEKDTVYVGDSLFFGFNYPYKALYPYENDTTIYFALKVPGTITETILYKTNEKQILSLPKYHISGTPLTDSVYKMYFHIPFNMSDGEGMYRIQTSDSTNCNFPNLYVRIKTTTVTLNGTTLTSSSAIGNQWYFNGNIITGATAQNYTATQNGSYIVKVNGSATSAPYSITTITGIVENSFASTINIYPNPFTSQATITFSEEQKNTTIKIIDVLGCVVKTITFTGTQLTIEKGEMNDGIYFLQIIDGNKQVVNRKIVVQ